MKSKEDIWTEFVAKVTASDYCEVIRIAHRLHKGHDLIFGRNIDPAHTEEPKA